MKWLEGVQEAANDPTIDKNNISDAGNVDDPDAEKLVRDWETILRSAAKEGKNMDIYVNRGTNTSVELDFLGAPPTQYIARLIVSSDIGGELTIKNAQVVYLELHAQHLGNPVSLKDCWIDRIRIVHGNLATELTLQLHKSLAPSRVDAGMQGISMHLRAVG